MEQEWDEFFIKMKLREQFKKRVLRVFGGDLVWPHRKFEKKKKSVLFFHSEKEECIPCGPKKIHLSPILNTQEPAPFAMAGLESCCECLVGAQPKKSILLSGALKLQLVGRSGWAWELPSLAWKLAAWLESIHDLQVPRPAQETAWLNSPGTPGRPFLVKCRPLVTRTRPTSSCKPSHSQRMSWK